MPDPNPQRTYLIAQALPKAIDIARQEAYPQSDAQLAKRVAEIACAIADAVLAEEQKRHG